MKKIIGMIMILLFFGVFFVGCTVDDENRFSEQQGVRENRENFNKDEIQKGFRDFEGMQKEGDFGQDFDRQRFRMNNSDMPMIDGEFDEEKMMQIREEMKQNMIDICEGKSEGDVCTIENQMGEISGICAYEDKNLICKIERPEMHMR